MRDHDWIWVAVVAWGTGLAALWCDHLQLPWSLVVEVRMLFGIVTCAAISVALFDKARHPGSAPGHELYLWTRLVSRWVYILMYSLALARMGFFLGESYQHCATCGVQHEIEAARPLDDFQFYVACCVIPLWLIRAVVLAVPAARNPPPVRQSTNSHAETPATGRGVA